MRFAALSDIHGNLPALEAVLADVVLRGCTQVVNLGDLVSGPLWPAETARLLMSQQWPTIRGNHERQLLEMPAAVIGASDAYALACLDDAQLDWMRKLPASAWFGDDVFLCHGTVRSDLEYFLEVFDETGMHEAPASLIVERADGILAPLTLCGHTHVPRTVALPDGRTICNPGSVGLPAFQSDHPTPHRVESGNPFAHYAMIERDGGHWRIESLAIAYDHESAASKAEREGRPDWATALRTGRMPAG